MKKLWSVGAVVLALVACAPSLREVQESDLGSAPAGSTLESLRQGRVLYAQNCSGCHMLYQPSAHTPQEWDHWNTEMFPKTRLTAAQQALVTAYLHSLARR